MSKRDRTMTPGGHYLVTNRGTAQTMIYRDDRDRRSFLGLLGAMESRFGVAVLAYVLLGNHYHLVVRQADPRLGEAMQFLDGTHARRFNALHDRRGALFQGRYDARFLDNDVGLQGAGYYVHLNPWRAGLTGDSLDYPWSSLRSYGREHSPLRWLRLDLLGGRTGSEYTAAVRRSAGLFGPCAGDSDGIASFDAWHDVADFEALFAESDAAVAAAFEVSADELYVLRPGRVNVPRAFGIAHAFRNTGLPVRVIADRYGLTSRQAVYAAASAARLAASGCETTAEARRKLGLDDSTS